MSDDVLPGMTKTSYKAGIVQEPFAAAEVVALRAALAQLRKVAEAAEAYFADTRAWSKRVRQLGIGGGTDTLREFQERLDREKLLRSACENSLESTGYLRSALATLSPASDVPGMLDDNPTSPAGGGGE